MDPNDREELCNTGPDEETVARERKRSRRVSFAEITSVHVFDRDEEYETPPDSKPDSENQELGQSNEVLGLNRFVVENDDSKESSTNGDNGEDEDEEDERELFVRSMDSSSPGSAVGSVASYDEDNFFGPVSASFIRSGGLSDSAASDDNHDITLDSTAFSMHFQSLMQSDSRANLKTPTGVHINFEDKTPTQGSTPSKSGSFMVLTEAKKLIASHSGSGGKSSAGGDSNNMSLVDVNPHRYDYGQLSPTLDALLAEGGKDIRIVAVSDETSISKSSSFLDRVSKFSMPNGNKGDLMTLKDFGDRELKNIEMWEPAAEVISGGSVKVFEDNGGPLSTPVGHIGCDVSVSTKDTPPINVPINQHYQTHNESRQLSSNSGQTKSHLKSIMKRDSGNTSNIEDPTKEKSPNGRSSSPDIHHNSAAPSVSPGEGSASSLHAKRQKSFLDAAISCRSERVATPFAGKQLYSFSNKDIRHDESLSSIKNSISKLKVLENCPLGAMQEFGGASSKTASPGGLGRYPSFATLFDDEDMKSKPMGISMIDSQDHLSSTAQRSKEQTSTTEKESHECQTPKNMVVSERNVASLREVEHSYQLSSEIRYNGRASESIGAMTPPLQFSGSGKDVQHHLFTLVNLNQGVLGRTEPDSSSKGIRFKGNMRVIGTPGRISHSPVKWLEEKLYASTEHEGEPDKVASDATPSHSFSIDKGVTYLGSSLRENRPHATLSTSDINVDGSTDLYSKSQEQTGNTGNYRTPLRHVDSLIPNYGNLESFQTRTDPAKFKEKTSERASFYGSASPDVRRRTVTAMRLEKKLVEGVKGSSTKEADNLLTNDNVYPVVRKSPLLPATLRYSSRRAPSHSFQHYRNVQEPYPIQDVETSGRKRRIEEVTATDKERFAPGRAGNMQGFEPKQYIVRENEAEMSGGYESPRLSVNVFSRFSEAVKGLILPDSAGKLGSWEIDALEDMLDQLQKAKRYEMLRIDIQSQRTHDHLGRLLHERIAKGRTLQQMVIHQHAKFQLLCLKKERLLRNIKLLELGILEAQNLKVCLENISIPTARNAKKSHFSSLSDDFSRKSEVAYNKMHVKRQVLGDLDEKLKSMTKSLLASRNVKGERSPSETITLVNDHLRKKTCCSYVHRELQLWQVDHFGSVKGCHNLVVNYCHALFQRFIVNSRSASAVTVLNTLNDENIMKSFPNLNACQAFVFVFNTVEARKLSSSKGFAAETQKTNALLGNLLDVVEEVQKACIEFKILIQKGFHSSCAEQLELQLCFINFNTGHKVILTFDMTCLKCGVYPSDILPRISLRPASLSFSAEIGTAIGALKTGHSRIIRLCSCISHLVQASSR